MRYESTYPHHEYRLPEDFELGIREEMLGRNPALETFHDARIRFANLTPFELRGIVIIACAASAITSAPDAIRRLNENTPLEWAGAVATVGVVALSRRLMGLIPSAKILERRMRLVPTPYIASHGDQDEEWVSTKLDQLKELHPALINSSAEITLEDIHRAVATFAHHNLGRAIEFPRIKDHLLPPYNPQYFVPTGEIIVGAGDRNSSNTLMEEFMHAQGIFREAPANMAVIVACLNSGSPPLAYNALLLWRELIARYRDRNAINREHEGGSTHPAASEKHSHKPSRPDRIRMAVRGTVAYLARRTPDDKYNEYTLGPLELLHAWRLQYRPDQDEKEKGL